MGADEREQRLQLRDRRMLAYVEYGAPDGVPIFYFHGHPGSRREWPAFDRGGFAAELNARIIAVDRPGHGRSDFKRGRAILDWPDDVAELADALHLDRFAVLGISGGGPYAAACAFQIAERLSAAAIMCGMGPADAPGMKDGTAWKFAAGRGRLIRRILLMVMRLGLRKKPEAFVAQMNDTLRGPDKALLLEQPGLAAQVTELSFAEAFRAGIAGVDHEARLYGRPWGFRLQDIPVEVHLWHGTKDDNVPVSVGRYVARAIPNCNARIVEDAGHLSLVYRCLRECLEVLVRPAVVAAPPRLRGPTDAGGRMETSI